MISHWFPLGMELGEFLLWMVSLLIVFLTLLIGSLFMLPPKVDLVPGQGPIRLDI